MLEFTSLWVELGHDSDPEARNTEILKILSSHTRARAHVQSQTHTHAACWICPNELENWSLESHLSEQSEMRL